MWQVTYGIGLLALLMFSYTFAFRHELSAEGTQEFAEAKQSSIPYSFQQKLSFQEAAKRPFFALAPIARPLRLPDLRSSLTFHGCNERPDLSLEKMRVQFTLRGASPVSASADEKVFLRFDGHSNRYTVSEKPTSLSIAFHPRDGGADVTEEIQDETGAIIATPADLHHYFVNLSSVPQTSSSAHGKWEVGDMPAEPMLLERQNARWYGKDEMILALGGEEYSYEAERERVQFGTGADAYVLWIKEGDVFVYSDGGWRSAKLGPETKGKILLRARKVDERQMFFDLWNPDGSCRVGCALSRRESRVGKKIPEIRVIGARSQKLWIAEIDGKRMTLTPTDWIVFSEDGVTKIENEKTLDKYIEGALSGSFVALNGIKKVNNESCFTGTFFDPTRTSKEEISIPLYRSWSTNKPSQNKKASKDLEEDVDDMDEEDDDDSGLEDSDDDDLFSDDSDDDDEE